MRIEPEITIRVDAKGLREIEINYRSSQDRDVALRALADSTDAIAALEDGARMLQSRFSGV